MDNDFGLADYTPGLAGGKENIQKKMFIPTNLTPKFTDKHKEREYQKGRLALAFRIFSKYGFDEGVAGHITLRDPVEPTSFWVNPFGVSWARMRASDLIRVDHSGNVVDGGAVRLLNTAAYMIHHAVHTARPEVNCVAHAHTIYGRTWCAIGRPLDMLTQDHCSFYNDLAVYNNFRGAVLWEEEGNSIAEALGSKKAALLQNHGLLTTGKSVEAAVFWFISLEKCCHTQLMADAAANGKGYNTIIINHAEAAQTFKTVGSERAGLFSGLPIFTNMIFDGGESYKD